MEKLQLGPCVTFFPQPTTLVSTVDSQGQVDIMTASWTGIVSKTPPTMAISLNKGRLSYANILQTGCFVVNGVPSRFAVEADYCGIRSGRDRDKLLKTGLSVSPAVHVQAPLIVESPLNLECRLVQDIQLGDYHLLLGEILEIHAAKEAVDENGELSVKGFDPLVYLGGIREYWSLGEKVANAYQAGLVLDKGDG
jgi:flavin reductase (DIM6/NTAB) family NADH-FMN oxidoreductase RutF